MRQKSKSMNIAVKVAPNAKELKMAADAGFRFIEVYTEKRFIARKYSDILNSFQLGYAVHAPLDCCDRSVVDFAASIGAKAMITHGFLSPEKLKELVEYAGQHGIAACIENSGNHFPPHTIEDFFALKKRVPGIKMCLDIEHTIIHSQFPDIIAAVGKDIRHVHMSGYNPSKKNFHSPPFENPAMVRKAVHALKKAKFSGFLTAEMDEKYQTPEIMKKARKFMESSVT